MSMTDAGVENVESFDVDTDTEITDTDGLEAVADISDADISDADEADLDEADLDEADLDEAVRFDTLGLPSELISVLAGNGVETAFPIQALTIPDALAGRHVLGKARTGSGKTLAFGLPMLANLSGKRARKGKPLGLVLVPTRELAMQVSDALQPYGFALGVDITAVYGGAPMYKQVFALRRGVEVLVATPGRLTDLIEQEECDLSEVAIAILDEADQMADMGFMPIVSELLGQTDPAGQRLLFSATLDGAVDELVQKYMTDPVLHSVASDEGEPIRMDHHLLIVEPTDKALITAEIAARHTPGSDDARRTILFARTKLGADRIAEKIREAGVSALALHGGMTQRARTKTLADFKDGRVPVLVATDVAARGIHVDGIDLVLHVDPANDPKDYLHRAGRTARAGESGTVVTLVLPKQRKSTLRLLEAAGVEAELTKVAPSSDVLRELTGGRPVAEYIAEADAWREARRAAREARMQDERGGFGEREGRGGFRGNRDRDFGGRDGGRRFEDRGDRGSFGGERRGFGERGDRRGFGERGGARRFDERGDRETRGGFSGERRGFDRDGGRGSFAGNGGERTGSFGGERRSFDRDGGRGSFAGNGGERRSFGDRNGARRFEDRGDRGFGQDRGGFRNDRDSRGDRGSAGNGGERTGSFGGERRGYGDRDRGFGQDRGGFRNDRGFNRDRDFGNRGGERRFEDRGSFGRDRDSRGGTADRDSRSGGFGGERRDRDTFNRNGGERRGFNRDDRQGPARHTNDGPWREPRNRRSFDNDNRGNSFGRTNGERRSFDSGNRNDRSTFSRNGGERRGFNRDDRDSRPPRDRRW